MITGSVGSSAHQFKYQSENTTKRTNKNGKRIITWYNPPFNKAAKTNVGRKFLDIIRNTFKASHLLKKICNKNLLKISYSSMSNMGSTIADNNKKRLNTTLQQPVKNCNCLDQTKCSLDGKCLESGVIYQATTVTTNNACEKDIGLTYQQFKVRYSNHNSSFKHHKYKNSTELSKYVWTLKESNTVYNIKRKTLTSAKAYNPANQICNLCLTEKYLIMCKSHMCTLNKRNELASSC